ncbi:MAG: AMP-binding protein [Flavobacterium sp. BFFFF2]|nr:MAG: AMP-binding protein [Flavobacterium sp. BFFFF2]
MNWRPAIISRLGGYPLADAMLLFEQLAEQAVVTDAPPTKVWDIVRWHWEHTPFFKNQLIDFPKKWDEIPILTKKGYQAVSLENRLCSAYKINDCHIAKTAGSTGEPLIFAKDKMCHALTWAANAARYQQHGLDLFADWQARFYGMPLDSKKFWIETCKDRLAHRKRFSVMDLSEDTLELYIQSFQKKPFAYVYGYANSLLTFAHYLIKTQRVLKHLCPSIRCAISTSELLLPEDRPILEQAFGVKIIVEYGVSELDIVAFDDAQGNWILNTETIYVEVVDDHGKKVPEGVVGNLVITSFYNKAHPFIRFAVGDRGAIRFDTSLGKYLLEQLEGRQNDQIRLPSGKIAAGYTCTYVAKALCDKLPCLRELAFHQYSPALFEIIYVSDRPLLPNEIHYFSETMAQYLEPGLDIKPIEVFDIPKTTSGKLKRFTAHF